jgi:hypothetical protein
VKQSIRLEEKCRQLEWQCKAIREQNHSLDLFACDPAVIRAARTSVGQHLAQHSEIQEILRQASPSIREVVDRSPSMYRPPKQFDRVINVEQPNHVIERHHPSSSRSSGRVNTVGDSTSSSINLSPSSNRGSETASIASQAATEVVSTHQARSDVASGFTMPVAVTIRDLALKTDPFGQPLRRSLRSTHKKKRRSAPDDSDDSNGPSEGVETLQFEDGRPKRDLAGKYGRFPTVYQKLLRTSWNVHNSSFQHAG